MKNSKQKMPTLKKEKRKSERDKPTTNNTTKSDDDIDSDPDIVNTDSNKNNDDDDELSVVYTADEDAFFDTKNFENFNNNIKFHIYDPDKYEVELHKEIIIVPNKHRRTSEVITLFEYTEVVSNRAKQIENGSMIFVSINKESNPIKIAELEIKMKKCPLSIRRLISSNIAEIWDVNEMINLY